MAGKYYCVKLPLQHNSHCTVEAHVWSYKLNAISRSVPRSSCCFPFFHRIMGYSSLTSPFVIISFLFTCSCLQYSTNQSFPCPTVTLFFFLFFFLLCKLLPLRAKTWIICVFAFTSEHLFTFVAWHTHIQYDGICLTSGLSWPLKKKNWFSGQNESDCNFGKSF